MRGEGGGGGMLNEGSTLTTAIIGCLNEYRKRNTVRKHSRYVEGEGEREGVCRLGIRNPIHVHRENSCSFAYCGGEVDAAPILLLQVNVWRALVQSNAEALLPSSIAAVNTRIFE